MVQGVNIPLPMTMVGRSRERNLIPVVLLEGPYPGSLWSTNPLHGRVLTLGLP